MLQGIKSAGAQLGFTLLDDLTTYVRLDSSYQDNYTAGRPLAPGHLGNFFTRHVVSRQLLNLRAGVKLESGLDVNLFVQNLLGENKQVAGFGDGRDCTGGVPATADCSTYGSYNPFVDL